MVLSLMILGYSIYRISSNKILENTTISLKHTNETLVYQFHGFLEDLKKDVQFLAKNPFIDEFIRTHNNQKLKEKIQLEFMALLEANPNYSQIRLIGLGNKGKEIIRVDRFKDHLGAVSEDQLQMKGDRDYFRETIQLKKDSIYFSEINLNQEFGQIIFPMVPTLRVASPLYLGETVFGIVIINVNLNTLFGELSKSAGSSGNLKLFNQSGYYLIHSDTGKLFRFEFNDLPDLDVEEFTSNLITSSGSHPMMKNYIHKSELESVIEYEYPRNQYKLYFNLSSDHHALMTVFNNWKKNIVWLTLILTLLSLAIALYWTQRQSRQFNTITQSIIQFGKNPDKIQLNIQRDDEIGDLAKSFIEMSDKINDYVRDLKIAKKEAEEANRAKQEFLETMSHEIRNPLQSIMGMVEVLDQNKPRADQQNFIDSLKFSSEHLHTLVSDILDYRKLLRGQLTLSPKKIYLSELIRNIVKSHSFDAIRNKIRINLQVDKSLETKWVLIDPVRFSQIVNNLLSNAIRISPENTEMDVLVESVGSQSIKLSVMDKGPGISDENIKNILQQSPLTGKADQHLNYGLGLPIVINLLKLFNSQLEIQSAVPGGSVFSFHIHVDYAEPDATEANLPDPELFGSKFVSKAVCIDDDVQNLFFYKQVLDKMEIPFEEFSKPEELSGIEDFSIALLISDANFNEGLIDQYFELILRKMDPNGVFLLISASEPGEKTAKFLKQHHGYYLQKPVSALKLEESINDIIRNACIDFPDYTDLYEQYDSNYQKIAVALDLMTQEWKEMKTGLIASIRERDLVSFDKIVHRMINNLKNLKLNKFNQQLTNVRKELVNEGTDMNYSKSSIELTFQEYIRLFEKKKAELKKEV